MPTDVDNDPTRRVFIDCGPPRRTETLCGPPSDELKPPRGLHGFWHKVKPAAAQATRKIATPILKVGAQTYHGAQAAGRNVARKVIGLQRSADLPVKLMEASARNTLERPMPRLSDLGFQQGYKQVVQQAAPEMFVPMKLPVPEMPDIEMGQ